MYSAGYPWNIRKILSARPRVGMVLDLSEENYASLMRLAPALTEMSGKYQSNLEQGMDLHLEALEQTPYTTLVHLTYYFSHVVGDYPDPDATLRVYHDSRQIDVMDLRQSSLPLHRWGVIPPLSNAGESIFFYPNGCTIVLRKVMDLILKVRWLRVKYCCLNIVDISAGDWISNDLGYSP